MTRFSDFDWSKVSKAMGEGADLIRLTPAFAQLCLHPYGHIEVYDNGGEVNVYWSYVPGIVLPFPEPECIQVGRFALFGSVPYSTSPRTKEKDLGERIKATIDNAIMRLQGLISGGYLYLARTKTTPEIRVVKETDERFHLQTREEGKLWKSQSSYADVKTAMGQALKWGESKKNVVSVAEMAEQWSDKLKKKYQPGFNELSEEILNEISALSIYKASAAVAYIIDNLRDDEYRLKCFLSAVWGLADKD